MPARGIKITNSSNSKMPTAATNAKKSVVPKEPKQQQQQQNSAAPSPAAAQQQTTAKGYLPGDIRYKGQAAAAANTTAVVNQQMSGKKTTIHKCHMRRAAKMHQRPQRTILTPPRTIKKQWTCKEAEKRDGTPPAACGAIAMCPRRLMIDDKDFLYILDTEGMDPKIISEQTIKVLHANIGEVTVGGQKVEATAAQVPGKMVEFVEWLNAEDAQTNDVATFAATAHYKMAKIHPFLNGNGRTCRLLM
ncbi:hypothetical protein niasHT_022183 [Heterodera trifolii]|uniref:Fido domain-containing protein n=1 Tax=Heterodera trifolii TaxID=157864 RepID=A0ABD2JVM8_9BILA